MVFWFIAKLSRRSIKNLTKRQQSRNLGLVLARLSQGFIILIGTFVALAIVIPSFKAGNLIQLLGVSGVAVGFAFRDILQNFLAGILILITEPFTINDQIVFKEFEGTVEDIQIRATKIKTYDGRRIVIPNAELFTNSVTVNTAKVLTELNNELVAAGIDLPFPTQQILFHDQTEETDGDRFNMEELKNVLDCKRQGFIGVTNVVNYLTNHDHNHLMTEFANREIFDESAFKRAKLGAALMMTAVGVPMIWMGEEFGEYKSKTIEPSKIDWRLLENDANRSLFDYYKGLVDLRKNNHAFYQENIDFFHEDSNNRVLAYCRWNEEGSRIVVIINFSNNFLAGYQVTNFPANGTWHEWTHNYEVETYGNNIITDLSEYEAKVFVWQS